MVREHIDTIDSLMARYVAGTLPLPAHVLVQSHLELREGARTFVSDLEAMAGDTLESLAPAPIAARDDLLDRIFQSKPDSIRLTPMDFRTDMSRTAPSEGSMPLALRDFVGFDIADVPWRTKMPGFKEYDMGEIDGCHVSMFWLRPGRAVPAHTHHGCEISLVLKGAFSDGMGRYGPGDISVADDDIDHRPVAESHGPCIGFAVTDAPLRLTGSFRQLIGDLIG
ncbi:ChrR family anti-sigma-E factor [Georhizobium sp. MAB10]|uniref:ChrR family anti-sigma-E factor n=1 Tax=Georhizobium sp. MAB10 TaxID=3028319 RepID=UPI003855F7FA